MDSPFALGIESLKVEKFGSTSIAYKRWSTGEFPNNNAPRASGETLPALMTTRPPFRYGDDATWTIEYHPQRFCRGGSGMRIEREADN